MKFIIKRKIYIYKRALKNQMREEKRGKIFLIQTGNAVNSGTMDKFSNEKQDDFALFNLCKGFCKALYNILLLVIALFITSCNDEGNMIIDIA